MEARGRIELPYKGFADLSLTTWVPRPPLQGNLQPGSGQNAGLFCPAAPRPQSPKGRQLVRLGVRQNGFILRG
jgi:hypothetical protein